MVLSCDLVINRQTTKFFVKSELLYNAVLGHPVITIIEKAYKYARTNLKIYHELEITLLNIVSVPEDKPAICFIYSVRRAVRQKIRMHKI